MSNLIPTERDRMFEAFTKKGGRFRVETKPHKSMRPLVLEVVDVGKPEAGLAWAVFRKGSPIEFFTYGQGDAIPDGVGGTRQATAVETDLSEGGKTTGDETFVIEGISASRAMVRVVTPTEFRSMPADPAVLASLAGLSALEDPAAIIAPPQVFSPFNLQDAIFNAIAPACAIELEWDRTRKTQIGTLDEIGEGGPKSFLRSNGEPHPSNRYKIPEGYVWRAAGRTDSNFLVRLTAQRDVVIPLNLAALGEVTIAPTKIVLDLAIRLHGMRFARPSTN